MDLNLYNFEDEEFADSKYVLTSPRSLQACDMLGVKPASLLYKPLADFQDELLPTGLPLRSIYDTYDGHERSRQKRLRECREYRDKIIRDNMYNQMTSANQTSHYEDAGYRSEDSINSLHQQPKAAFSIKDDACRDSGSMQRQRTASVIGRQLRSKEVERPHSVAAFRSPPDRKGTVPRPRSATPTKSVSFTDSSMLALYKSPSTHKVRTGRPRSAWTSPSRAEDSCNDLNEQFSKSLAISDLSTLRSPDLQPTYLRNKELRRSVGYSSSTGRVSRRDERILEALHSKNQREADQELNRSIAQLDWEEEKLRLQREKEISEYRRRQLLAQRIAEAEEQQALLREKQLMDEEELRQSMVRRCEENDNKWRTSSGRQQRSKSLAAKEKKRRTMRRKLSQERLLAEFEQQREKELNRHLNEAEHQQLRASARKDNKFYLDKSKKQKQNEQEVEKHRRRLRELERACSKYHEELRSSLSQKQAKSVFNQSRVAKARDYTLHVNAKQRQQKFERSKMNLLRKEEEMSDWQRSLKARRRLLESKARLTAAQTVELKALRAQAEREERELNQRRSYSRIQKEAELSRRDQKDAIVYKDAKMKLVQHHKDNIIGEVRSMAATSQRLREELRRKYGNDSFAKTAFATELQNKVGRGHLSANKNKSTVLLA